MTTHHTTPTGLSSWWRPVLIGVCVGVVCTTLVLLLCAFLLLRLGISPSAATPMAVVSAAVGSVAGGFAAGLCGGRKGLLLGAVCGTLFYALVLAVGLISGADLVVGYALLKWAVLTVCSAAGGVLGVNRRHS